MSLIDDGANDGGRRVRMANLACVGSMSINGVAQMHSELLKQTVLKDFFDMWPKVSEQDKWGNPPSFYCLGHPPHSVLIDEVIGGDWLRNLEKLSQLEQFSEDTSFLSRWSGIKLTAKQRLSTIYSNKTSASVSIRNHFSTFK